MLTKAKLALASTLFVAANAAANDDVAAFFQEYVSLGNNFDPAIGELYHDQAKMHATQILASGEEKQMVVTGAQLKQILPQTMIAAKERNAKQDFNDVQINEVEGGWVVSANRYSQAFCYTDSNYAMGVVQLADGSFIISSERMTVLTESQCK